jgi:cell division transport system permease protein
MRSRKHLTESPWRQALSSWLRAHAYAFFSALGRLLHRPLDQGLTITVLAVALTLPALGLVALDNGGRLLAGAARPSDLLLFMIEGASAELAADLADRLRGDPRVVAVETRSPAEALEEFRSLSGFADALVEAESDPLPWVLSLRLREGTDPALLAAELKDGPAIDAVTYEGAWLSRLEATLALARRALWIIGGLLAAAVLLIVGNTVRLEIATRQEEIEVIKLIGASDAFVRRPFLYGGLWLGLCAGSLAVILVGLTLLALGPPARALALSYGSSFTLEGLGLQEVTALIAVALALGWLGAFLATAQRLRAIDPR